MTEFVLDCHITFDAADVASRLTPMQVVNLIEELDLKVNEWEVSILLHHYFKAQFEDAKTKRPELVALSVAELEELCEALADEDEEVADA